MIKPLTWTNQVGAVAFSDRGVKAIQKKKPLDAETWSLMKRLLVTCYLVRVYDVG